MVTENRNNFVILIFRHIWQKSRFFSQIPALETAGGYTRSSRLFCPQDMRNDRGARTADVLRHTDARTFNLRFPAFAAELLGDLHDLIHPGGSHRMTARLQPAACTHRYAARGADFVIESESDAFAALGESAGFQR